MRKILTLFFTLLFLLSSVCYALPQPLGEVTKDQISDRYFKDKSIDLIEGTWTTTDNRYEFSIIKNTSGSFPDYDYLGIIVGGNGHKWKRGEIKALFKKTSTSELYTGVYYNEVSNGIWGTEKKEYGTTFTLTSKNLLTCSLPIGLYGLPVKQAFLRTYPSYDASQGTSLQTSGTGFLISSNIIATNYHVISNAREIEITFQNEIKQPATVIAKDPVNDIALLRVTGLETRAVPVSIGQPRDIKEGEQVFSAGFPLITELGTRAKISEGIINSLTGMNDDFRMVQFSIPIQPGNSGSPVFNNKGQVIGIVTATLKDSYFLNKQGVVPQNVGFAIKINYLNNLLSSLPDEVRLSEAASPFALNSIQIMDMAKQSIVLVVKK